MTTRAILISLLTVLSFGVSPACEMVVVPPAALDAELTTIIGAVRQHVTAPIDLGGTRDTPGVLVEITQSTARLSPGDIVAIFPLGTGLDCDPVPRSADAVSGQYPVGATVVAVGQLSDADNARMLSPADSFGHLSTRPEGPFSRAGVCLDFGAFSSNYEDASSGEFDLSLAWRNFHRQGYEDYEFQQCVIRLQSRTKGVDAVLELAALGHYSRYDQLGPNLAMERYSDLLKQLGASGRARKALLRDFRSRRAG